MRRVAVLGSGLLGGSIALAAHARVPELQVSLWGRNKQSIKDAHALGLTEATEDLVEAIDNVDILVLATPVGSMLEVLNLALKKNCNLNGVIITDVGSVKLNPRNQLAKIVEQAGAYYIGSHPMAGSEQTGIRAADSNLFVDATCFLTNDFDHPKEQVLALQNFWQDLGCHCLMTSSEKHDEMLARISHFPHIISSLCALVSLQDPNLGAFSGNGLKDTTRIASGSPEMWTEILLHNRQALQEPIEQSITALKNIQSILKSEDTEKLTEFLQEAKDLRDKLS